VRGAWALVALIAVAVVAHGATWVGLGPSEDELALVQVGPAWRAFEPVQLGINPPLWPFLVNALLPDPWVVVGGRVLALACHVGSVLVGARLAARLAPGAVPPVLAALLLAASPNLAASGVAFRAYAPLTLVALLHLDAAVAGADRRWVATAAVLPWLHYLALPWTALGAAAAALDPARRGLVRRAWPALLAWAPPVAWIVTNARDRDRFGEPLATLGNALALGWFEGTAWVATGAVAAALVVAGALRARPAWPLAAGAAGALAVLASATLVQEVRPPAVALYLAALLPLLGARPGLPAPARLAAAGLAVAIAGASVAQRGDAVPEIAVPRALPDMVRGWSTWREAADGEPVQLPWRQVSLLLYQLDGRLVADLPDDPTCPDRRCFTHDGLRIVAAGDPSRGSAHGLVLAPAAGPSPLATCPEIARVGTATLRRCP
jgi:hypothetical protein